MKQSTYDLSLATKRRTSFVVVAGLGRCSHFSMCESLLESFHFLASLHFARILLYSRLLKTEFRLFHRRTNLHHDLGPTIKMYSPSQERISTHHRFLARLALALLISRPRQCVPPLSLVRYRPVFSRRLLLPQLLLHHSMLSYLNRRTSSRGMSQSSVVGLQARTQQLV